MAIENNLTDSPGIEIKGITEMVKEYVEDLDLELLKERAEKESFYSSLEGYVIKTYEEHKNARQESGIDTEMIQSVYQSNGEYLPEEISQMTNRSQIFMNLTATKKRAGVSWIQDILQPANAFPMEFRPSPVETLPEEIEQQVRQAFERDQQELVQKIREKYKQTQQPQQAPGQEGQPQEAPPEQPSALSASKELREINELRRDLEEAITSEINKVARQQCHVVQTQVLDDLKQGEWDKAFSEFINDFLIYPTAFMKGPIVSTKKRLTYKGGKPVESREVVFMNKRVSPFDIYPSPSADSIYDGNFIEHIRLSKKELSDLAHIGDKDGFKKDNVIKVLKETPGDSSFGVDNHVEEYKVRSEKRGNQTHASTGVYHGLHFWGTASVTLLKEWGVSPEDIEGKEEWEELEIEIILVNKTIIKCAINKDPLGRRPYYSASYNKRSGSIWGKSMPASMRDIQRMCNGSARALADNMGLSAGPQCAVLVDRLADDGPIEEQKPLKIWQFNSDPQGNGGRPIEWFTIPSNANELLAVYDRFEIKADDVTGIPRYAYGNEQIGGAGQTMGGLSILMESASKGIKSAIKNISEGVLVPRAEYQFYLRLLKSEEDGEVVNYHGDINVIVYAAEALTLKTAEQEVQRELLKATMNEYDMGIIGKVGRADMLRKVFKTANFSEDIVPSRLEVKMKDQEDQAAAAKQQEQAMQLQQEKNQIGLQATQIQIGGQKEMHEKSLALKEKEVTTKAQLTAREQQLKAVEIDQKERISTAKEMNKQELTKYSVDRRSETDTRRIAADMIKNRPEETPGVNDGN